MGSLSQAFVNLKGKKVVVTGDTGFKGSWLSLWLHLAGAEVFGYALPPEGKQSHFSQLQLEKIIRHEDGDVRDSNHLINFMQQTQPEIVFTWLRRPWYVAHTTTQKLPTTRILVEQ